MNTVIISSGGIPERLRILLSNLDHTNHCKAFNSMKLKLEESIILSNDIDKSLNTFVSFIEKCASTLFLHQLKRSNCQIADTVELSKKCGNVPWFNEDCADLRCSFYTCLNLYRGDKSDENRIKIVQARSQYKTCIRKARLAYDKSEIDKLRYQNGRDYWKLLKSALLSPKANIKLSTFERYFKAISTPDSDFYVPDDDILFTNDMSVTKDRLSSLLKTQNGINFGLVKTCVKL